jgi:antitoxin component YwqK of YwqJK toxin-antitoxin module
MKKIATILIMALFTIILSGQNPEAKNGVYYSHYPNGELKAEYSFVNNLPDSQWKYYDENGIIVEIRSYRMGEFHGTWKTFNKHGILTSIAHYKNNLKHGTWIIKDDDGEWVYKIEYDDGEKISVTRNEQTASL